jgi:hypothetical protein
MKKKDKLAVIHQHYPNANTKYNCKYLILNGAIHINSDSDVGSFSESRKFDVINLITGERINHLLKN